MQVTISLLNCSQKLMHTMYSMHFFQYKLHHNSTNLLLQQGSWLGGERVLLEKEEDLHVPVGVFTVNANAFFHKFFTSHLLWLDWGFNNRSSYNTSGITNCLLSWITFCVWSIGFHFISVPDCLWSCSNILLTTIKKKAFIWSFNYEKWAIYYFLFWHKVKQTGNKNKEKFKLRYVTGLIPNSQELVL